MPCCCAKSAHALLEVARDHKDLGAKIGLLAVLQTWTRDLRYHPHVHCVVPAGGLSPDACAGSAQNVKITSCPRPRWPCAFAPASNKPLHNSIRRLCVQVPPQFGLSIGWPMSNPSAPVNRR